MLRDIPHQRNNAHSLWSFVIINCYRRCYTYMRILRTCSFLDKMLTPTCSHSGFLYSDRGYTTVYSACVYMLLTHFSLLSSMFQRVLTIIFLLIIALKIPLILVLCVIVAAAILWVAVGFHVGLQDGEFIIVPL